MTRIELDIAQLRRAIADMCAKYPELSEDDELFADALEGETDLHSILARLVDMAQEAKAMEAAIKSRMNDLKARADRYGAQSDRSRALIQALMTQYGQTKVTLPEATLSISKPRKSVAILDINDLPQGFYSLVRHADKAAIKTALDADEDVPGAALVEGDASLTVRVK